MATTLVSLSERELLVRECPFCGAELIPTDDGNCPQCGSRARTRSLAPLLGEVVDQLLSSELRQRPLLAFAMTRSEQRLLRDVFNSFASVSLHGNYRQEHEVGVDIRDLSRYEADSFSGIFGVLLFDYFVEIETAMREAFRVTAPGGVFFTHVAPYRLLEGDAPPVQTSTVHARPGSFEYLPDEGMPSVKVGRDWFVGTLRSAGFEAARISVKDAAAGEALDWFVGLKPQVPAADVLRSFPLRWKGRRVLALGAAAVETAYRLLSEHGAEQVDVVAPKLPEGPLPPGFRGLATDLTQLPSAPESAYHGAVVADLLELSATEVYDLLRWTRDRLQPGAPCLVATRTWFDADGAGVGDRVRAPYAHLAFSKAAVAEYYMQQRWPLPPPVNPMSRATYLVLFHRVGFRVVDVKARSELVEVFGDKLRWFDADELAAGSFVACLRRPFLEEEHEALVELQGSRVPS